MRYLLIIFVMGLGWFDHQLKGEVLTLAPYFLSTPNNLSTMEVKEIFKDIPLYPGSYQISTYGNVKSLVRKNCLKERILKPAIASNGYYTVSLFNGKPESHTIHTLMAITFLNHIPCKYKIVVDHIDFNKLNNHLDNLRLRSNRQNSDKKHIKSTSKYVGVCWDAHGKKWRADIVMNGKSKYLGYFTDELEASVAYQLALNNIM